MSLAAYAPKATPTHSSFAALLKQSRFSSFDRTIGQVYTTYGGDAHRGNWGFKRPLGLRRRGAYITVKNVDTPEHQTEWSSAEPQAMWMKNWDELKITPQWGREAGFGDDEAKDFILESDYVPLKEDATVWRRDYIPNLNVMTQQEFKNYLAQIRAKRDTFYAKERAAQEKKGAQAMSSYQLSNLPNKSWDDAFAKQLSRDRRSDPRSREIEHMPHRSGGLTYAQYSPLQTFTMTKERKGRLAEEVRGKDKHFMHYVASFAGIGGLVPKKHVGTARPMVWQDPNQTGEVMIRPQKAFIRRVPNVVGRMRQGLKGAKLDLDLVVWDGQSHNRSNPHPVGSRKYISAEPPLLDLISSTRKRTLHNLAVNSKPRTRHGADTLSLLRGTVDRAKESS
ncbi:hypothetical protein HYDPIDRAFT_105811 [Hydnomerulius pinastri MD-312]|nr:hypothetical protein HYDPIDRAFT_105811 [Hydnomerulius pinastri MD-312]